MTNINEKYIIDFLSFKAGRPLKLKELAHELEVGEKDYPSFEPW